MATKKQVKSVSNSTIRNKDYSGRLLLVFLILFVLFLVVSIYLVFITKERIAVINELRGLNMNEKISLSDNLFSVYSLYNSQIPSIDNRIFFGSNNSYITFVSFLDFNSSASKIFIFDIYPKLYDEYIKTGKMKYYPRVPISKEEFTLRKDRFIYAQTLYCFEWLNNKDYYSFYLDMFKYNVSDIHLLLEKYNVSKDAFETCFEKSEFDEMKRDVVETKLLGLNGVGEAFYIGVFGTQNKEILGVSDYDSFRHFIHLIQVRMGD